MQNQQQGPGDKITMRGSFDFMYALAVAQSTCVTPFIRSRFGAEGLGWQGLGAFILLFLWAGGMHSRDLQFTFIFWLFAVAFQRVATISRETGGDYEHTRYLGWPFLMMLNPFIKREKTGKLLEGVILWIAGMVTLNGRNWPVGYFLLASGTAILFVEAVHEHLEKQRTRAMRDAEIEMRYLTEERR